jgi:hypothetical protein
MSRRPYVDAYSAIQEGRARTMAERQAEEALRFNQARQMAAANSLRAGRVDPVAYSNELARMGFAHMVPGEQKPLYELEEQVGKSQEALGKGAQAQAKVLSDRFQYFRDLAPANPSLAPGWVNAVYTDPIVGPELAKFGTPEEVIAAIPSDATEYNKWLEGVSMVAGDYAKRRVPTAEAMLPYTQPKSSEVFAQDVARATAGAPRTSISTKGDTAEEVKKAESRVAEYNTIRDRAMQGRRTLPSLQRAASALEKFETGFGSEAATEARRVLVSFGLGDDEAAEKVKSADAFAVAVKDRILFKLSQQAGTQTEGDAQRAEDTWASFRKLTDSNKFLIDLEKAVIAQDNEQLKFYDDWEAKNGTYRGAAQAWRDGPGSKSLFDRPEMKKYADRESAAQSAANPIRVKTVEEAENLPPGTVFITPNGKRKVR